MNQPNTLARFEQVVWWRGPSKGRLTAVFGAVEQADSERIRISYNDGYQQRIRWVPIERIQLLQKCWHKTHWYDPPEFEPLNYWARFKRYLETGEDLFAIRQVDLFENGYALRYDRNRWIDRLGSIATLPHCQFRRPTWWGPEIPVTLREFDKLWESTADNPGYELQLSQEPLRALPQPPWGREPVQIGGL